MRFKRGGAALLLAVPLFAYIFVPLGSMLAESFTLPVADFRARQMGWDPGHQPFGAPLRRVFSEPSAVAAIWGTLKISIATVVAGGIWGAALALLWGRRDFFGRRSFAVCGYAPLLMPPLVGTMAFYQLLGETGVLWRIFPSARESFSPFMQVLAVHTHAFGFYTFAFVSAALDDFDPSREDAARSLGAGRFRTFFAAAWPAIKPAVLAAALLTFMASAASFSAPYLLDNQARYLTVEIFNPGDEGMQRALSTVLAFVSLAALPGFLYFSRQGKFADEGGSKGAVRKQLPPARGIGTVLRVALSVVAALLLVAPPLMVVAAVFEPTMRGDYSGQTASAFSLLQRSDFDSLLRSAEYGAAAALIAIVLAILIALALRRAPFFAALPVELAVMLALALPGSSVAIALLSQFNGPSKLAGGIPLGGTAAILILAYVIRDLPLAVRPVRAALQAVGNDLENAARSLGASRMRTLFRVTLPLMLPTLIAAGLICFVTAAGEFVASILLSGVSTTPVSVRINEVLGSDKGTAYGLAFCLMVLCAAATIGARWVGGRSRNR